MRRWERLKSADQLWIYKAVEVPCLQRQPDESLIRSSYEAIEESMIKVLAIAVELIIALE